MMPVYSPENQKKMTKVRMKPSIPFFVEEAVGYLTNWCEFHENWAPDSLGRDFEKLALEHFTKNSWAWDFRWETHGTYEHPTTRAWADGRRYCFNLSDRAFKAGDCIIHEKASDLRAWVTCWKDDTILVKIEMI